MDAFRVRPGQLDAGGCQPGFREGSRGRPGRPGDGGPRRAAGCGGPRPGHTVTGTSARIGDGLSTHHDEFILAASASATTSRSGHGRRPAPTHSVQIGLANLWQTAVAGPPGIQQAGHVPRLSCWFGVEPPAGIEPATPSLPSMVGPFGGQRGTSLRSIELQVAGLIDDREMGCCEAVCGAAAGKSLARMQIIRGPGRGQRRSASHAARAEV
jgi:hypothetical protein